MDHAATLASRRTWLEVAATPLPIRRKDLAGWPLVAHQAATDMRVEQAIFTSLRSATHQGYQLAARSSGIGDELAHQLRQWSPSHGALFAPHGNVSSLNCYSLRSEWLILSRTVYGAPEYSGRGALQVVTVMLAAQTRQLQEFADNPIVLARTALALGYLRLPAAVPARLAAVRLPDQPLTSAQTNAARPLLSESSLQRSQQFLAQGQRIALVATDAHAAVAQVLAAIPAAKRRVTSFTTGLRPSRQRPFQIHVVPAIDSELRRRLSGQGIQIVSEKL